MKTRFLSTGIALLTGGVLFGVAELASAGSASTPMTVQAVVPANCSISVTSNMDFGSFDNIGQPLNYQLDGQGTLSVACTKGTNATISLTTTELELKNGSEVLTYQVYSDEGRTTAWGIEGSAVPFTGTGAVATPVHVYGRINSGQTPIAGSYSTSLTFTIDY